MDPTDMFEDPWNPTAEEIRRWAHSDEYVEQDWEVALVDHLGLLVELVDDRSIHPDVRRFLLGALYVNVGDAVRGQHAPQMRSYFAEVIRSKLVPALADAATRCEPLRRWADRSRLLISGEAEYTYGEWGIGGTLAQAEGAWFRSDAEAGR